MTRRRCPARRPATACGPVRPHQIPAAAEWHTVLAAGPPPELPRSAGYAEKHAWLEALVRYNLAARIRQPADPAEGATVPDASPDSPHQVLHRPGRGSDGMSWAFGLAQHTVRSRGRGAPWDTPERVRRQHRRAVALVAAVRARTDLDAAAIATGEGMLLVLELAAAEPPAYPGLSPGELPRPPVQLLTLTSAVLTAAPPRTGPGTTTPARPAATR